MNLDDLKNIQSLADTYSCSNLVFQGDKASFTFLGHHLEFWKVADQFSTLVFSNSSNSRFTLGGVATLLNRECSEPFNSIGELNESILFVQNHSNEIEELLSEDDLSEKYAKVTGVQPLPKNHGV